jgi:predicted RNA-binding protein with EMAP domain
MKIEVSNGEIVDKYTILVIKSERINDKDKLRNINKELKSLERTLRKMQFSPADLMDLISINDQLWIVEDKLREMESDNTFDERFIDLARSVYKLNDYRAEIKKRINISTGSLLVEEKSYLCDATYKSFSDL